MKTRTEILLKYTPYLGSADITYKNILKAMSEVEQQTRDEMFEFVEWITDCDNVMCTDGVYFIFELSEERGHTLKQCFDYFKSLNK